MSAAWFRAAHPAPNVTCLGLRLRPYSLGHELLLTLQESPLAPEDGKIPLGLFDDPARALPELALASIICSQTYEAGLKSLRSRFAVPLFAKAWAWLIMRRGVSIPRALMTFEEYRQQGMWFPETNKPSKGRALGSPWQFRMLACLMRYFGYSESQALNMPLSKASALYAAWLDHEGDISLWNEDDERLFGYLEKKEAEGTWD